MSTPQLTEFCILTKRASHATNDKAKSVSRSSPESLLGLEIVPGQCIHGPRIELSRLFISSAFAKVTLTYSPPLMAYGINNLFRGRRRSPKGHAEGATGQRIGPNRIKIPSTQCSKMKMSCLSSSGWKGERRDAAGTFP